MQTRVTDQPGFILRRRDWRNTSLLLDLFTRLQYQPFVALSLSWTGRQELKTLTAAEGQALSVDQQNYLALLYINELIAAMLPPQETNPEVFDAYLNLLGRASLRLEESDLRRFEVELLRVLGLFPDVTREAESEDLLRPESFYQFVINRGFVSCAESARDSVSGRVILDWIDENYEQVAVRRLARAVMRSTIDFNLHGKTLKSRDVYAEILKPK